LESTAGLTFKAAGHYSAKHTVMPTQVLSTVLREAEGIPLVLTSWSSFTSMLSAIMTAEASPRPGTNPEQEKTYLQHSNKLYV